MRSFKTLRLIFHGYAQRALMFLIATWCFIFVVMTVVIPIKNDLKTKVILFKDERLSIFFTANSTLDAETSSGTKSDSVRHNSSGTLENRFVSTTRGNEVAGALNLHIWSICGFDVQSLKQSPLFPLFPDQKFLLSNFTTELQESEVGQRIFGFLYPHSTGRYKFAIISDDASELWLSTNEDPRNVRLIAEVHDNNSDAWTLPGDYKKYPSQTSKEINLKNRQRYFVECLHKNGAEIGHVSVLWKLSGSTQFSVITGQFLFPFCNENNCNSYETKEPLRIPSHAKQTRTENTLASTSSFNRLDDLLDCACSPHTSVYPEDVVQIKPGSYGVLSSRELRPNIVLPKDSANLVVSQFMSILKRQNGKRLHLQKVIGVEGKEDKEKGNRYLLELKIYDTHENKYLRLTEYVFRDYAGHLWFPKGLTWTRNATIHFIVPVKNQLKWIVFLLEEMSKLYQRTRDENFRLVIVDFGSTDGDINKILQNNPLAQKCTLLKKSGAFHKTLAIQDAVKSVSDPNSIVFLFDLHITVPVTLLDSIRKHTIQSKIVFLPIVARLDCGFSPVNPKGRWEEIGSGLVAVYKSDWERFRGMNVDEFKTKWGGEDWDLLDRMLRVGLESERLKIPEFYHFYHTKMSMWDKKNRTNTK